MGTKRPTAFILTFLLVLGLTAAACAMIAPSHVTFSSIAAARVFHSAWML
jgi:hypothetical protein